MPIEIIDYADVRAHAAELGCNVPTGIALLPRNFRTAQNKAELMHESSSLTVRTLWRRAGIAETPIEPEGERFPTIIEDAFSWAGPTIFIAASVLFQNPQIVSVTLNIVSNYLTDFFKGTRGSQNVKLSIVVEQELGRQYKEIRYEGDKGGLEELAKIVEKIDTWIPVESSDSRKISTPSLASADASATRAGRGSSKSRRVKN